MVKFMKISAASMIIISLLLWLPNIVFPASSLWIFSFVFSGIGILLSVSAKSKILIIGNTLTFLLVMFLGYLNKPDVIIVFP